MHDPSPRTDRRAVSELTSAVVLVVIVVGIVTAIGSSVLFLENEQSGPQAQFSFDYNEDRQYVLVEHDSGDTFAAGNLSIQGPDDASARWSELASVSESTIIGPDSLPVRVGESGAYGEPVGPEDSLRVVYIDPESGDATVLDTWNGTSGI